MDAISCLAPPPAVLLANNSFADAAIARALHFSMSSSADDSSSLSATQPFCDSVLVVADSPTTAGRRQHKQQLAPAGGTKRRRSRASKRAPTTYISTDTANFRIMVQQITGVQADMEMLMAADASATVGAAYGGNPLQLPVAAGGDAEAIHHQQQPCFPTLDSSWNVMYERSELLL